MTTACSTVFTNYKSHFHQKEQRPVTEKEPVRTLEFTKPLQIWKNVKGTVCE